MVELLSKAARITLRHDSLMYRLMVRVHGRRFDELQIDTVNLFDRLLKNLNLDFELWGPQSTMCASRTVRIQKPAAIA